MKLETTRLIIRSLQPEDEQAFIQMASDGSLYEIFGDCSECDRWMKEWIDEAIALDLEDNPNKDYLTYVIETKADGRAVGSVGTSYYEDLQRIGVTYFIGEKDRGRGYTAEALRAFAAYLFEHFGLNDLFATARVENIASCRTLENAGFILYETKMYQDLYDPEAELSHFYEIKRDTV